MSSKLSIWLVGGGLLLAGMPVLAHHSFAAEYDGTKPIKVTGTVVKFELTNPHSWIYIDVMSAEGKIVNWGFETAPVGTLYRRGLRKDTVTPGMVVTIEGFLAKDGTRTANAQKLTLPDGKVMVLGTETRPD